MQEGEISTVEVTRRPSEERDLLHTNFEEKDRRLQRWRDKLGARSDESQVTTSATNIKLTARKDSQVNIFLHYVYLITSHLIHLTSS